MIDTIKSLEETNSRKKKERILSELEGDEESLFKYICFLTYDPSIDFYVKEFDDDCDHIPSISLLEALTDLQNIISTRTFTGNRAKQWVEMTYSMLDEDSAEVFKRVIKRDLRCGVSAKTINKIWPGTIYEHPYMRASSFSEKNLKHIKAPCYSQTKMDGLYCDIMVFEDKVEYRSRNGSFLPFNGEETDNALIENFENQVLMGEAIAVDEEGDLMDRQSSNGYLNSGDIDRSRIKFFLWDMVPLEDFNDRLSERHYEFRLEDLAQKVDWFNENTDFKLEVVETVLCHDQDDIIEDFKENRLAGEEGSIIKDLSMEWKPGASKKQIKVKVIFDCDLKIVDYKMGTGKNEGKLGALIGESSCGKLKTSVGIGFKDGDREEFLDKVEQWIQNETVMAVKANDVVTNQSEPDKYALFHSRFIEVRTDKKEADDLGRIQEQVKAFTDALKLISE